MEFKKKKIKNCRAQPLLEQANFPDFQKKTKKKLREKKKHFNMKLPYKVFVVVVFCFLFFFPCKSSELQFNPGSLVRRTVLA